MEIYEYPKTQGNLPRECLLALGFFDGVHIAHRDLLRRAKEIALSSELPFGVFTFKSAGRIKSDSPRLYDDEDKAELFAQIGADFVVYADFNAISSMSAEDFVEKTLIRDLRCKACVAGFNFRFGRAASAGTKELVDLMESNGGQAYIHEEITAPDGRTLSASLIRDLIKIGDIEKANYYLGSPYYIKGRVSSGRQDGRTLGFPTANIDLSQDRLLPKKGVYSTLVAVKDKIYSAVTNIGTCPTFNEDKIRLEAHIIDFNGDIYGEDIRVYLLGFIREERRFDSPEELKEQINLDRKITTEKNGELKWLDLGLK